MISLLKPRQPLQLCKSSHAILVSNWAGKLFAKFLRSNIEPVYESSVHDGQSGGRKGRGADFAAHTTIQFFSRAKRRGLSAGYLFLDISAAFYSVVRQCTLGCDGSSRSCAECLRALGLCQEVVGDLLRFRRDHGSILQKAGVQADTVKLLREYHADTWVSQVGLADITHVVRGTIAGNPLGDLIFGFLFNYVVQEVRAQLLSEGIHRTSPFDPEAPWLAPQLPEPQPLQAVDGENVSYVDDEAV